MKSKQELLEEAAKFSKEHEEKKQLVENILSDLDKEEKISNKHINGIATINEILKEMEDIEIKHTKIIEEIKK